jgi:hypothetical protein
MLTTSLEGVYELLGSSRPGMVFTWCLGDRLRGGHIVMEIVIQFRGIA